MENGVDPYSTGTGFAANENLLDIGQTWATRPRGFFSPPITNRDSLVPKARVFWLRNCHLTGLKSHMPDFAFQNSLYFLPASIGSSTVIVALSSRGVATRTRLL